MSVEHRGSQQNIDIATIVVSLLILTLPLAGAFLNLGVGDGRSEKRELAAAPSWDELTNDPQQFTVAFEKFFNDRFGFRSPLIRYHNRLKYDLLSVSSSRKVVVGKEGWIYYKPSLSSSWAEKPFSKRDLARTRDILEARRIWLARRGIRYLFVVTPNKATIYPEHLPSYLTKIGENTRLEQLYSYLDTHSSIRKVDLTKALLDEKKNDRVYNRLGTHWNDLGAFIAYREIIDALGPEHTGRSRLTLGDFTKVRRENSPGLAQLLALEGGLQEQRVYLESRIELTSARKPHRPVPGYRVDSRLNRKKKTGSLLVFGDSFTFSTKLKLLLSENFERSTYLMGGRDFFLREVVDRVEPTVVIQQIVERNLFHPFAEGTLDSHCSTEAGATYQRLYRLDAASDIEDFRGLKNAALTPSGPDGKHLMVEASTTDPYFQLPAIAAPKGDPLQIKVSMSSPGDSVFQVYYRTATKQRFSGVRSVRMQVKRGNNKFCIQLPSTAIAGRLRIDPGRVPGRYSIQSLEVSSVHQGP